MMKRILLFSILALFISVTQALAVYEVVVIKKGTVAASDNIKPVLTSISFNGTTFSTTQSTSASQIPAYRVNGGVEAWGYENGVWTFLFGKTDVERYTGAAYTQLLNIWAENYTYDPALGPPAYQFPNGLADITNPPEETPLNVDKAISFLLGGLTGFGFVMASCVRW